MERGSPAQHPVSQRRNPIHQEQIVKEDFRSSRNGIRPEEDSNSAIEDWVSELLRRGAFVVQVSSTDIFNLKELKVEIE